ncbi:MAG: putative sugar nucleotidyl transferase [Reichenbachiella sp.]
MNIALIDLAQQRSRLFPLTYTRPVADLRVGILTIREKWEKRLGQPVGFFTTPQLSKFIDLSIESCDLVINGAICPSQDLVEEIQSLSDGEALFKGDLFLGAKGQFSSIEEVEKLKVGKTSNASFNHINRTWDIFLNNSAEIQLDYDLITKGRSSSKIEDPHTIVYGAENVFLEEGVKIKAAILNAENGPIYLGKGAEIQEGATIRGPFSLGEGSRINMNAKIREGSTIGPSCKIGGEVSNAVIWGNSNKAHDGFLGNSVLGQWCNLGADTNNSNLKNNYAQVGMWDDTVKDYVDTGLQFCGLVMGDHSKSAINTMFNTGTTVGVCCNVYGGGFPKTRIPSFTWGGVRSLILYYFDKAMETAALVKERKEQSLSTDEIALYKELFDEIEASKS